MIVVTTVGRNIAGCLTLHLAPSYGISGDIGVDVCLLGRVHKVCACVFSLSGELHHRSAHPALFSISLQLRLYLVNRSLAIVIVLQV